MVSDSCRSKCRIQKTEAKKINTHSKSDTNFPIAQIHEK